MATITLRSAKGLPLTNAEVDGNFSALNTDKSEVGHTHPLSDVTDSGTAAGLNVPATGDAAATEVVKGDDTRLSDSRTPTAHTHVEADITDLGNYQVVLTEGAFVDGDKTKLNGIETNADVTDTANVTAAGALMDTEVINLAQIKAFNSADYVGQTSTTGSAALPVGTTAQRDGTPSTGYLRYNSTDGSPEVYDGSGWVPVGGGGGLAPVFQSSTYTAQDGEIVVANTSGAAFTVTLPAAPTAGMRIGFVDDADWSVNNLIIARNGATIEGAAEDLVCNIGGIGFELLYNGTTWQLPGSVASGGGSAVTETSTNTLTNKTIHGDTNTLTVDGTNEVGFRKVPLNDPTGTYTLQTSDVGKAVTADNTITVPNSTFASGDVVSIYNSTASDLTVTCSITTAYIAGSDTNVANVTLATRGMATVLFLSATTCVIAGNVS